MSKKKISNKQMRQLLALFIIIICSVIAILFDNNLVNKETKDVVSNTTITNQISTNIDIESVPEYTNESYVTINNNVPYFEESEYTKEAFETYSELDSLGRCGVAYANICKEIMPKEKRKSINEIKPTGWVQRKYNGEYLYNRCHLIGHQLAGEDANKQNLVTGTKYFNVEGMLPFENMVADYIRENPNNHVLYRVTPIFKESNLVASGVEIEGYSVEDNGSGISFNVYIYNVQPGIYIDYETGNSSQSI